jgi:hypothetical protein
MGVALSKMELALLLSLLSPSLQRRFLGKNDFSSSTEHISVWLIMVSYPLLSIPQVISTSNVAKY